MHLTELDDWQYRLTRWAGESSVSVGELFLEVGKRINRVAVSDIEGTPVGFLVGFPIDLATRTLMREEWTLPLKFAGDIDGFVEATIDLLGGRFALVSVVGTSKRLYLDCSGQVPCVFDAKASIAGSTAHAVLTSSDYEARFDHEIFSALELSKDGWAPAGLTAHRGLERLLPNHYLDLSSWRVHRAWPRQVIGKTDDPERAVGAIVDIVQAQVEALVSGPRKVALALTAGRDTRLLLACARPYLEHLELVTVVGPDRQTMDTVMARRIAKELDLPHLELTRVKATPEQVELFVRRGGHAVIDSNAHFHPSMWPIANSHVFVGGLGGEIGRGFLWREDDQSNLSVIPQMLVSRFGLPQHPKVIERLSLWLEKVPTSDTQLVLDLAYIEHRMGPWYGAQFCCDPTLVRHAPLITQTAVRSMLSLGVEFRRGDGFVLTAIEAMWPELLEYPFNTLGWWRDVVNKTAKVFEDPALLRRRLRKRLF